MTQKNIPNYFVYGEPVRTLDVGFLHVELVSARKNLHRGMVAAHKHPQMAQITFWTKGGGTYHIEDLSWTFSAPAISFVPSGVVHGFTVRPASDAIVVSIANDALDRILSLQIVRPQKAVFLNKQVNKREWKDIATIMRLLQRAYTSLSDDRQSAILHMVGAALACIARQHAATDNQSLPQRFPLAQRLQLVVDKHFRERRAVGHYVKDLHTTYHLLDKAAKSAFAMPVKQLVMQRRLLEAKRLLQFTIRSADDIAHELGFNDPAYFNREFKKHTGLAPGIWRSKRN